VTSNEQAKRIYELCVASAKVKKTLKYGEVLHSLGYKIGVTGNAIRYGLELVLLACAIKGLPMLTSIVVNQSTGRPSDGGLPIDINTQWEKVAKNVFDQKEWPHVNQIEWAYVWDNRKQLSEKHGTKGYWGKYG
jgi:hypothetical protein